MDRIYDRLTLPDGASCGAVRVSGDRAEKLPSRPGRGDRYLFPGFVDVHVHLREPGFSYKETVRSGTRAASRGGYTAVCAMPNLSPVPDSPETLRPELDAIARDGVVSVYPYGAITRGEMGRELSDMEGMRHDVIAFSDDGRGVMDAALMREAMKQAARMGKIIAAHCEDTTVSPFDPESEWRQAERDIALAAETGCRYHICHVSCRRTVEAVRRAKRAGMDVSCETAPHYILLDQTMRKNDGAYKMNPPLRSPEDREAVVEALLDGTIDMIATDHAPHSAAEKSGGFATAMNGIVGLETAFPVLYTGLVRAGLLPLHRLIHLLSRAPGERFGIPVSQSDFSVFDLSASYTINPDEFLSQGRATPFAGWEVAGKCLLTSAGGRVAWQDVSTEN